MTDYSFEIYEKDVRATHWVMSCKTVIGCMYHANKEATSKTTKIVVKNNFNYLPVAIRDEFGKWSSYK